MWCFATYTFVSLLYNVYGTLAIVLGTPWWLLGRQRGQGSRVQAEGTSQSLPASKAGTHSITQLCRINTRAVSKE